MSAHAERRWWEYAKRHRLFCPEYHHKPRNEIIPEWGFFRCGHWVKGEHRECGLWTFQVSVGGNGGGGGVLLVALELAELAEAQKLTTPTEVLDYLNVFPPFVGDPLLRKARRLP